ncbi:hypothetical protein VOLCADRAFT_118815 [Volvox carteri f. nagariensis]|uniref:Uncharacterized protein n=1 Tax=Volvox carteri f. nagariensis TaxID=3068 RepID=D8U7M1_VOLCA|nr:uncharacterized protein VOLCADRAFT_118815 [Volvox carteri f. nagariensis]EFJ44325.1 hypothetical protein VOLCADRAFT_118815 [Volvox carteri f. nagariensis]|eukprot:XP_002954684.1 hypothetical protein VOLCADRAFT_118815 [Volvox carteri f. nagariensis]
MAACQRRPRCADPDEATRRLVPREACRTRRLQSGVLRLQKGPSAQYEILPYREYRSFYIPIPSGADYDLAVTVESIKGDVDLQLLSPNGTLLSHSEERIGDDVVQASRTFLNKNPGNYTLLLQTVAGAESWYNIKCCPDDDDQLPDSCSVLLNATSSTASLEQDLCLQPPNMCNEQVRRAREGAGQIIKLVLSGGDRGNFVCPSFPTELGQLPALQVLDWASNSQVGTLASVAAALSPLSGSLRRLYLGRNALSGPLGCELVNGTALEILRLERNLLTSPSLRQLSLAGNLLHGSIPAMSRDCALKLLDLSENGPPLGLSATNKGMQGPLPSLGLAANLNYLNVQSNSLTGTSADLRVLDLSRNQLTGTLAPRVTGSPLLTVLRLAGNRLSGALPSSSWSPFLLDLDLSENGFTGQDVGDLLNRSTLVKVNLAVNNLSMDVQVLGSKVPVNSSILYFNVSHNNMYGRLTEQLGRMQLFNQLLSNAVQDDEAPEASLPPQPLFDVSYNLINSTFPLKLLSLLSGLYWASPYDYVPLSLVLQPQNPPGGLTCPSPNTDFPPDVFYLAELQELYDLTCLTRLGQRINISSFQNVTIPRPPKRPGPPRPPPPLPPRPPVVRRLPPSPSADASVSVDTGGRPAGQSPPPVQLPPGPSNGTSNTDKPPSNGTGIEATGGQDASHPGGSDGSDVGHMQPTVPQVSPQTAATADRSGGGRSGGSGGAIAGGVIGGLVALAVVAVVIWYLQRRSRNRRNVYSSRRVPLTFNTAYEAPSEGTVSNYGDMQLFELKPNAIGGRGRIAGILVPGGLQDVVMGDQTAVQLPGTSTDAELEELYNALPGWHQQQSLHSGALFGGLARTVSAPCAFLPSASALSPGNNGPLSMAPLKEHSSVAYPCFEEVSSFQKQTPFVARWLLNERPTAGNIPLHNYQHGDEAIADGFSLASDNRAAPAEARLWPSRLPSLATTTVLPPGGENHTAMTYRLVNPSNCNFEPTNDTNDLNASHQLSCLQPSRAVPHNNLASSSSGGGNGSRTLGHYVHFNQPHPHSHAFPSPASTGLSDWPSGGRLIGGSTGLGLLSAASTGTGASVLSDTPSGPYIPSRHGDISGGLPPPPPPPPPPPLPPPSLNATDRSVCGFPNPSPSSTGPAAASPYGGLLGLHAHSHSHSHAVGPGGRGMAAAAAAGGEQGPACGPAVADVRKLEMISEGAVGTAAEGSMQLDMEQDAHCDGGGRGGGGNGSGSGGGSGGTLQSASSGSSMCAAIDGALMAAAGCDMSVSADGAGAGAGAGAATGKIKLEKEELQDLVYTVEMSLARAVTEQKETIAALQAKVDEQDALIRVLQEKVRLYETQHQQHQKQHDGGGGGGGSGGGGGGAKAQGSRGPARRFPES